MKLIDPVCRQEPTLSLEPLYRIRTFNAFRESELRFADQRPEQELLFSMHLDAAAAAKAFEKTMHLQTAEATV